MFVRQARARPDKTHLPAQHVDELRQLIQAGCADYPPKWDEAGVSASVQLGHRSVGFDLGIDVLLMRCRVRAGNHGATFVEDEHPSVVAYTLLLEDYGNF